MSRAAIASINLNALQHNLSVVKETARNSKILAVIKANAYGHGLLQVAEALDLADAFAVAHFEEASSLRKAFPEKDIILLQGFADEVELSFQLSQSFQPVVHALFQIELLENFAKNNPEDAFIVWLKLDTGMHRLGLSENDFSIAWKRLSTISNLRNIKVMSHFANADAPSHPENDLQFQVFEQVTNALVAEKSLSNSAALLTNKKYHYDWVRPGIMLYGVSPFVEKDSRSEKLQPVMTLTSRIVAVNEVKKNETVGYGSCWRVTDDTHIAIVGIGYGDGYPRHIAENTPVLIDGKRYPIVGRVSMDMICVDLGKNNSFRPGEEVTLWGNGLPVEEIAEKVSTIAYELLCRVTARVKYIYQQDDDAL